MAGWPRVCRTVLLLLAVNLFAGTCDAFFPWDWRENWVGGHGTSHQAMTAGAFRSLAREQFKVETLSPSMTSALDTLIIYNARVDNDQFHSEKHCDAESFPEARTRLMDLMSKAVDELEKGNSYLARQTVGEALHTVQDFYSHSTFIERLSSKEGENARPTTFRALFSLLGHIDRPGESVSTCKDCRNRLLTPLCPDCQNNLVEVDGQIPLTSGYYPGNNRPQKDTKAYKCQHGGVPQIKQGVQGINKDSKSCAWSPHYHLHNLAAQSAELATVEYITAIKTQVSERQFESLFGLGPSLGFAVDMTSSLMTLIPQIREQLVIALTMRKGGLAVLDRTPRYVLTTFADISTTLKTYTSEDREKFKTQLARALSPSPIESCRPASMEGILATISNLEPHASLFAVVGGDPSDVSKALEVKQMIGEKHIQVLIIHIKNKCSGDGQAYRDMVDGHFISYFSITMAQVDQIPRLIASHAQENTVSLDEITTDRKLYWIPAGKSKARPPPSMPGTPPSSPNLSPSNSQVLRRRSLTHETNNTHEISIDPSTTSLTFSLHGPSALLNLTRPDGTSAHPDTDPSTVFTDLHDGIFVTISHPPPGIWLAHLHAPEPARLSVHATHPSLHISSLHLVTHSGRPMHQGYYPISVAPPAGTRVGLRIEIEGLDDAVPAPRFELRDVRSQLLRRVAMRRGDSLDRGGPPRNSFLGFFAMPAERALVHVSGWTVDGAAFQRAKPLPGGVHDEEEDGALYLGTEADEQLELAYGRDHDRAWDDDALERVEEEEARQMCLVDERCYAAFDEDDQDVDEDEDDFWAGEDLFPGSGSGTRDAGRTWLR